TVSRTERVDADETRELAMLLLARNGILAREMLSLESTPISWSDLSFALRRLEYSGTIRRGWFVRSLSGEQYALSEAVEMLRSMRNRSAGSHEIAALNANDPANPYGALLPGCGITREASNIVVVRGGCVILGLVARSLVTRGEIDEESFRAAMAAILAMRPRLQIETIDDLPALRSARVGALAAMQFHSDGRSLVYDGLPGPTPSRATL
ncbi:MAG TPA: hypothetical protein VGR40_01725, partial [Candidatus Binatus sp.]|nr:hypothetical protein [Candidatus Binatus sp.]